MSMDVITLLDFLFKLPLATSLSTTDNVLVFGSDGLKRYRGLDKAICKITVNDGVDLDTLTNDGVYFISGNEHNGKPVSSISRSILLVFNQTSSGSTCIQLLIHTNLDQMYLRHRWDNVWGSWTKLAKDSSYVAPISGGG